MAQGPFILSWTATIHFYISADPSHTRAIASEPCPTLPTAKTIVGPTGLLHPGPPLLTTCCDAIMSCPLASDPGWGHGQSEREHERRSEECGSILGPQTSLVVSLGAQGRRALWPVLVMLCMVGTLQPPVVTPGEDATLFRVEAGEDGEAQVDGVVAGIRWGFQLLAEDIFEDVEVVPDE